MCSRTSADCDHADLKGASNYEDLFDSGYNSNMPSKTFLDSESDLEPVERKLCADDFEGKSSQKNLSAPQWSDSGVCITDSGLSINEDDSCETSQSELEAHKSSSPVQDCDLPKTWLKQNSEGDT